LQHEASNQPARGCRGLVHRCVVKAGSRTPSSTLRAAAPLCTMGRKSTLSLFPIPGSRPQQLDSHDQRILAPPLARVIVRPPPDLVESAAVIEGDGGRVRGAHFEENALGMMPAGQIEQAGENATTETAALLGRGNADVEDMRFAAGDREHAV